MADNTPVVSEEKTSAPKADIQPKTEVQPEATTEEIVPEFAKGVDQTVIPEAKETPVPEEEEVVLKKRLSGAISEVEKRNEEARRYVELQADIVKENNELIHKIAANDPTLANKVINKVWGTQGIRSYKQLLERSKLEELRTTNPDVYETKRKLMDVEARLMAAEEKERTAIRKKFLTDNGIMENEYDPNYRKLMDALDSLNPSLVTEDYQRALRMSKSIAFADDKPIVKVPEAPTLQIGGGKKPAPLPNSQPQLSDQSLWLAKGLNEKLGYKIPI